VVAESIDPQLGGEDADERHILALAADVAARAFLDELVDRGRIEMAVGAYGAR